MCRYWLARIACLKDTEKERSLRPEEQDELESAQNRVREFIHSGVITQGQTQCYLRRVTAYLTPDGDPATPPWGDILLADFGIYFPLV